MPMPPPREYREGHFHRRENIGKASATAARMSGRPFPPPREDREGQCRRREKIGKAISTAAKQQGGEKGIKGRTGLTGLSHLLNTSSRVPPLALFSPLRDVGAEGGRQTEGKDERGDNQRARRGKANRGKGRKEGRATLLAQSSFHMFRHTPLPPLAFSLSLLFPSARGSADRRGPAMHIDMRRTVWKVEAPREAQPNPRGRNPSRHLPTNFQNTQERRGGGGHDTTPPRPILGRRSRERS